MYFPVNGFPSNQIAMYYGGPISQQVAELMQADMDSLIEDEAKEDECVVLSDVQRCIEWRANYFRDMVAFIDEFELFQDVFTFKVGYKSEDPRGSFLDAPSKIAFEAFKRLDNDNYEL